MTALMQELLNEIPEVAAAESAIEALKFHMASRRGPQAVDSERERLAHDVITACREGRPLPENLDRLAYDAQTAAEVAQAEKVVLDLAMRELVSHRDVTTQNSSGEALLLLRAHLTELLGEVRELLPDLDGVSSAQEAISAGPKAAAAWATLGAKSGRYVEIREAQKALFVLATSGGLEGEGKSWVQVPDFPGGGVNVSEVLNIVGEVRNYGELKPDWIFARRSAPAGERNRPAFQFGDAVTHLHGLLTMSGADLWLPTVAEAGEAYAHARAIGVDYERQRNVREGIADPRPVTADVARLRSQLATARLMHQSA